jgi:Protein of unknown function (DUF4239)
VRLLDQPVVLFVVMFLVLAAMEETGIRLRLRLSATIDENRHNHILAARDAVAMLLSLILSFTMVMAVQRFDHRRELLVDEANAIGTASLRAQTLPEPSRDKVLKLLREYVDIRFTYPILGIGPKLDEAVARAKKLQGGLWEQCVAVAQRYPTPISSIFLQSINETIDLGEKRLAALENRIPPPVWTILVLISMLSCFIVGLGTKRRFWVTTVVWPLMVSIVLGLTADLDSPSSGLIQIKRQSLQRLQQNLTAGGSHQ